MIASPDACAVDGFSQRVSKLGSFMDTTAKLQFLKTRFTADLQIVWMFTRQRPVNQIFFSIIDNQAVSETAQPNENTMTIYYLVCFSGLFHTADKKRKPFG